jgi:hypothetical protein
LIRYSCFSQSIADKADIFLPMYWIFLGTHFAYSAVLAVFRPGNVQQSGRSAREWKLWPSVQRTVVAIVAIAFEPIDQPKRQIVGSYAPAMEPEFWVVKLGGAMHRQKWALTAILAR